MAKQFDFLLSGGNSEQPVPPLYIPTTRYQGSKRKIAAQLYHSFSKIPFSTALDLYSGTYTVSLILRMQGKLTDSNDYMKYNKNTAEMYLRIDEEILSDKNHKDNLESMLLDNQKYLTDVQDKFEGIFFTNLENKQIDNFCSNLRQINGFRKSLYAYAVGQALLKKRPYNLFHRANLQMRTKNVKRSFGNAATWEGSILSHALKAIDEVAKLASHLKPQDSSAFSLNSSEIFKFKTDYDLIYVDPPYLNAKGKANNYSEFYGFLDGLIDYNLFQTGDERFSHKPIAKMSTPWDSEESALNHIEEITRYWENSVIFFSYRSDGKPDIKSFVDVLSRNERTVTVETVSNYKYALSHKCDTKELFIISAPRYT